ncbi:MAG TPA: DUF4115 domain-containing protein [Candidatus Moranbacteria bacterium]|jgi:transcriptional regulator with XRE-family HTH domain|nr:DUF4115 domain-containing protein [Candidatus Moranbacteria bacterium]HPX94499.1 DUF4115 domain-containing protein [Candidatus Moranbacteria bacterium]HQB59741.1 DUF4115 domain-containing protein [Candidatus Moranbacteria bacterium]
MVRFTTKRIDSLTLGERMQKIRNERRLSLADVSRSTKIQIKYLEYLENGNYQKLPADVYVRGFLRSYAAFMGMNEKKLIKQYEREKGIEKNIKKESYEEKTAEPVKFSSIVITPKMAVIMLVILMAFASFWYLYREVDSFISTPRLVVLKPSDGAAIEGNSVHVNGVAEKDALVFINDQRVMVSENGEFGEDVGLKPGLNTITVKARNKFDKEAAQSVTVNANFQQAEQNVENIPDSSNPVVAESDSISAEIYVAPSPTWLSIEADGNLVYSGVLLPESVQKIEAKEFISVTTGKGNQTYAKINGKDLGTLSDDSGVVRDVKFNKSGKITNDQQPADDR